MSDAPDMNDEADKALTRPTPKRVAQRALVLASVVCRGSIEQDAGNQEADRFRFKILDWLKSCDAESELEESERDTLLTPLGKLSPEQHSTATWRAEGVAVLAWAIYRAALPQYYGFSPPRAVADALGWLTEAGCRLVASAQLRPATEISALAQRLFALHWRIADFRLRRTPINFRAFAQEAWFGPLDITGLSLIDDDLAFGNQPIGSISGHDFSMQQRLTEERRRAVEWLVGNDTIYSGVDLST